MLFDEKDLRVLESNDSRIYFKEILQLYYSQNYRSAVVMLYSFVIYDLFLKLQTMAAEGDKKAIRKLDEINVMIADDEKYSKVENEIIAFYQDNCPLYFNRFVEDIEYLKNCRNKCAHLKVNDNSLFIPSDYHVRMLICSMFDNVLSVKAPFITDLFSIVESDVEAYSAAISYIPSDGLDKAINNTLKNKYLKRMTYDSLKKSYKTFIRLLFVSEDEHCEANAYGLYAFAYAMTDYIVKEGFTQIYAEESIIDIFSRITDEVLRNSASRRNALISIATAFPAVMDMLRANEDLFGYISNCVLLKPRGLGLYRVFYPRDEKSIYSFFLENKSVQQAAYTETLYTALKECEEFNLGEFTKIMVAAIPRFNGFSDADSFMDFFKDHIQELSIEEAEDVMRVYRGNGQCVNRARHSSDIVEVRKHLDSQKQSSLDGECEEKEGE